MYQTSPFHSSDFIWPHLLLFYYISLYVIMLSCTNLTLQLQQTVFSWLSRLIRSGQNRLGMLDANLSTDNVAKVAYFEKTKLLLIGWDIGSHGWFSWVSCLARHVKPHVSSKVTQGWPKVTISCWMVVRVNITPKAAVIMTMQDKLTGQPTLQIVCSVT